MKSLEAELSPLKGLLRDLIGYRDHGSFSLASSVILKDDKWAVVPSEEKSERERKKIKRKKRAIDKKTAFDNEKSASTILNHHQIQTRSLIISTKYEKKAH